MPCEPALVDLVVLRQADADEETRNAWAGYGVSTAMDHYEGPQNERAPAGDAPGVRVVGDRVLIRRHAKKTQIGLIHTPDGSEVWPPTGEVVGVGPGVKESAIRLGARVVFAAPKSRPARALIPDDRDPGARDNKRWERVIVVQEDDVVAVFDTDADATDRVTDHEIAALIAKHESEGFRFQGWHDPRLVDALKELLQRRHG